MNIEKLIKLHGFDVHGGCPGRYPSIAIKESDLRAWMAGHARVPVLPTDAMLDAARDWSYKKYGKPIGNDAAIGCWTAMLTASKERNNE
jgi:hypothetical protein